MRIFWLLTDLFLVVLVGCLALAMSAAWMVASWTYDEPPLEFPRPPERTHPVPFANSDLPAGYTVAPSDIQLEDLTADEMQSLSPAGGSWHRIFMSPSDIAGRVLRTVKPRGEPFIASDFYLAGREPGAEPEPPHLTDPPWPPREELQLLIDKFSDSQQHGTIILPNVIVDLPAGRVVRSSDIALRPATLDQLREMSLPNFEVLLSTEQIIGRQLCKAKRIDEPFLLSDFTVAGEVEAYLQQHLPNFKSGRVELAAVETGSEGTTPVYDFPPRREKQRPAPIIANLPDNPDALFGALPEDAAYRPSSVLGKVLEDEDMMIQLAWRFEPILPVTPGVHDLRDVLGTSLAPPPAPNVAGLGLSDLHARTWFGGATLTHDTSTGGASGAIAAVHQSPTDGDYKLRLPRAPRDEEEPNIEASQPDQWWRKVDPFGIAPPNPFSNDQFGPLP